MNHRGIYNCGAGDLRAHGSRSVGDCAFEIRHAAATSP